MNLSDIHRIYFIGIGGIGMSALARYFNKRGIAIYGYDRTETELTRQLSTEGMVIHYQDSVKQIPEGIDLVVYTPAVPNTHQELQYFLNNGFPVKKRAEVLGLISRNSKTIAVAGTHGKTTTSTMIAHLLRFAGLDCTAFLGGIAKNFNSNYIDGEGEWVVVEADEFDRSFLHLHPDIATILSMDADHLDIYGDHASILDTGFKAFAGQLKEQGQLWTKAIYRDDFQSLQDLRIYGLESGDYRSTGIHVADGSFVFDYQSPDHQIEDLRLPMPGRHNVENATVAVSIALELGVDPAAIRPALEAFKGIQRRFERIYQDEDRVFFDDYAHHPTELEAAIDAAKELFPGRKVTGIFQPHLFSRTRDFADGFARALDQLDEVILLDIYPARELPIPGITAATIAERMQRSKVYQVSKADTLNTLKKLDIEVLLTLGAGDISTLVRPIAHYLESLTVKEVE